MGQGEDREKSLDQQIATISKSTAKVYIDGANMFYTQQKLGWFFDWKKLKECLSKKSKIIEFRYYTGIKKEDEKMKSFLRYLDHIILSRLPNL